MAEMFEGKHVFVTGAASGIGKAVATAFAKGKAELALADINTVLLQETIERLSSSGAKVKGYCLDVTDEDMVSEVTKKAINEFNYIDILINSAGVSSMNWLWKLSVQEWDYNMNVNAKGCWLVTKHIVPHMIERRKGKIVNLASLAGKVGTPLLAHYSASKFAVIGFTEAAAKELASYRINVNAVCPGYVRTPMQDREIIWEAKLRNLDNPEKVREDYIRQTPLGRLCEPDDVANVVLFLASNSASFITGQAINVTGGM